MRIYIDGVGVGYFAASCLLMVTEKIVLIMNTVKSCICDYGVDRI